MTEGNPPFCIFISSTCKDLEIERRQVLNAMCLLQTQYSAMEYYGADPREPIEVCLEKVRKSNIYVGIIAHRYGQIVEKTGKSYTQMEYEEARRNGIPCLIYIKSDKTKIPQKYLEKDPESMRKLKLFKTVLEKKHTIYYFKNAHDLFSHTLIDVPKQIMKLEIQKNSELPDTTQIKFKNQFTAILDQCINLLSKQHDSELFEELIDKLIELMKDEIEKWDVSSVKFGTKQLFEKLNKYSGSDYFPELYPIYKDLFKLAYSERQHLLESMIEVFNEILMGAYIDEYDVKKGEKASKVILRLGMDFIDTDLNVCLSCLTVIDIWAENIVAPAMFSKEILFGAAICKKMSCINDQKIKDFMEQIIEWIDFNDREAAEGTGIKTYLRDAIEYAKYEQKDYAIDVAPFQQSYLQKVIEQRMVESIQNYFDFLIELRDEKDEDIPYSAKELANLILAYEFAIPDVSVKIQRGTKTDPYLKKIFKQIVQSNSLLRKIYGGSEMITSFDELVKFLKVNFDVDDLGVGVILWGFTVINFGRKLNKEELEVLKNLGMKYKLRFEDYEEGDNEITFEMEQLAGFDEKKRDVQRVITFLSEVNAICEIKSIDTGTQFRLRKLNPI